MGTKQEKTKVCALDLDKDIIDYLKEHFDVYDGSLGKRVKAVYENHNNSCRFLLNYDIPQNVHEYEIFIEDMSRNEEIDYDEEHHTHSKLKDEKAYYFYTRKPQTVFNPVAYGSYIFSDLVKKYRARPAIKIVFVSEVESIQYHIRDEYNPHDCYEKEETNDEHLNFPRNENICGTQVRLTDNKLSSVIFSSFLSDIKYHVSFSVPYKWKGSERVKDDDFLPLLNTPAGAVISFVKISDDDIVFAIPQTSKKLEILKVVFKEILFSHFSDYFPEVTERTWINNSDYYLPKQEALLQEKIDITKKYESDITNINKEIEANHNEYLFLHTLLTATGDELVKAVIYFLEWLGFKQVIDKDTALDKNFNEEDIQIDLGDEDINGIKLLVIEVKGIGGTSTDSECSQIHKVVHRRGKDRKAYDVHGLYIVNNEMYKEPLKRTIPPFDETKISDAKNDDRGLCYTWQLFNLYFNIEAGIITKEEARKAFFTSGLLEFKPSLRLVGTPYHYYKDHTVASIEISNTKVRVGDYFYYCQHDRWKRVKIISIMDGSESFDDVNTGNYGFGLDEKIPRNLPLYVK